MKTAEEILREYVNFNDVNGNETVELLPLTIVDAMEEYAQLYHENKVKNLSLSDVIVSLPKECRGCGLVYTKEVPRSCTQCGHQLWQ